MTMVKHIAGRLIAQHVAGKKLLIERIGPRGSFDFVGAGYADAHSAQDDKTLDSDYSAQLLHCGGALVEAGFFFWG